MWPRNNEVGKKHLAKKEISKEVGVDYYYA